MPLDPVLVRGLTPISMPQPDPNAGMNQLGAIMKIQSLQNEMQANQLQAQKYQQDIATGQATERKARLESKINAFRNGAALAGEDPTALMGLISTAAQDPDMAEALGIGPQHVQFIGSQLNDPAKVSILARRMRGMTAKEEADLGKPSDRAQTLIDAGLKPGTPEFQEGMRRFVEHDLYRAPTEAGQLPADVRTAQWLSTQPPEIQALYFKSKRGENAPDATVVARTETDDDGTVHQFNAYGKEIATSAGAGKTKGGGLKSLPSPVARAVMENEHSLRLARNALTLIQGGKVGEQAGSKAATGVKGFLPDAALSRLDPEGVPTRAAIADLGSMIIHDRSGAAVTASEYPRLMPFIPKANDDPPVVEQKLKRFIQVYEDMQQDFRDMYSEDQGFQFPELGQTPRPPAAGQSATAPADGKNPPPTEEDIAYTAKKYNMSPDEVRRRLGMQ